MQEAESKKRRPTISAVRRSLGIPHATFYRNFPDLITWFKEQADATPPPDTAKVAEAGAGEETTVARLRRENEDLRRTVAIYAEAIRQLTVEKLEFEEAYHHRTGVTDLAARRQSRLGREAE